MSDALTKYLKGLPLRRLLGGFIVAIVWLAVWLAPSMIEYAYSGRFYTHQIDVLHLLAIFVAPLCVLGFLWGYGERLKLERALATSAERFDRALGETIGRHLVVGMMCGGAFFLFSLFLVPGRAWDSETNILANLLEVLGGVFGGFAVGLVAGIITLRSLRRRVSRTIE